MIDPPPESTPPFPPALVWLLAVAVISGVMLTAYRPVGRAVYGVSDDFESYYTDVDTRQIYRESGRPLLGLAYAIVRPHVDRLQDLRWLRRISLGGICLLGALLFTATRSMARDPVSRTMLVIALLCLPTITVFAAWATLWTFSWGAALGLGGGMVAWSGIRCWFVGWRLRGGVLLAISTAMVVAAMLIYQPSVSWFWVIALVSVLDSRFTRYRTHRRRVLFLFGVGLIQLFICFITLQVYFGLAGVQPQERSGLLADPVAKVMMLGRVILPMVLAQWQVVDVTRKPLMLGLSALSLLAVALGLGLRACHMLGGQTQGRVAMAPRNLVALWLALLFFALALSHVHWLAVDANVKNYRTVGPLAICVTLLLWHTLFQLGRGVMGTQSRYLVIWTLSLGMAVVAVGKARANLDQYWIYPYTTGYQFLLQALGEELTPQVRRIHLIRQSPEDGIVPPGLMYSFGRPLTDPPWVTQGLMTAALRDLPPELSPGRVQVTDSLEPIADDSETLVIDMRQLRRFRRIRAEQ